MVNVYSFHVPNNKLWQQMLNQAAHDEYYECKLDHWIKHGDTVFLRDELAYLFEDKTNHITKREHFNLWTNIDSAGMHFRENTDLAHLYTKG